MNRLILAMILSLALYVPSSAKAAEEETTWRVGDSLGVSMVCRRADYAAQVAETPFAALQGIYPALATAHECFSFHPASFLPSELLEWVSGPHKDGQGEYAIWRCISAAGESHCVVPVEGGPHQREVAL